MSTAQAGAAVLSTDERLQRIEQYLQQQQQQEERYRRDVEAMVQRVVADSAAVRLQTTTLVDQAARAMETRMMSALGARVATAAEQSLQCLAGLMRPSAPQYSALPLDQQQIAVLHNALLASVGPIVLAHIKHDFDESMRGVYATLHTELMSAIDQRIAATKTVDTQPDNATSK